MNKKYILTLAITMLLVPISMDAKKRVNKEQAIPQLINYPSAELSELRLHGGNFVFKGHIEGLGDDKIPKEYLEKMNGASRVQLGDYIAGTEKIIPIEFTPEGTFQLDIKLPYPMFLYIHPLTTIYACPGDTLDMAINGMAKTRDEAFSYAGTGLSGEVTPLRQKISSKYYDFVIDNKLTEQGPDSVMRWKDQQVAKLDDMVRQINAGLPELEGCSPLASDILRTFMVSEYLKYISSIYISEESMLFTNTEIDKEAYWQHFFDFLAPREKYLLDNPLLMISGDERLYDKLTHQVFRVFRLGIKSTEKLHLSPTDFSAQVCMLRRFFGTKHWGVRNFDADAEEFAEVMNVVSHPKLIRQGILNYREYIKNNEMKVADQKPATKGDSIFQRIIEPYKGNVLFVDFWEMTCGPCRLKMLEMRDEVKANKNKPVKYLYITDDASEKCSDFLEKNNIQGEHIFVNKGEWGYLQEKFNFSTIPFVAIYDQQGNLRHDIGSVDQLLNE